MSADYGEVKGPDAERKLAFLKDIAEVMKKHSIENCICIYDGNGMINNTYLPLNQPRPLYEHISDAIQAWLLKGSPQDN